MRYKVAVKWSEEDSVYVARVPKLPGCMAHGKTYKEAVSQIQEAIALWLETAEKIDQLDSIEKNKIVKRAV